MESSVHPVGLEHLHSKYGLVLLAHMPGYKGQPSKRIVQRILLLSASCFSFAFDHAFNIQLEEALLKFGALPGECLDRCIFECEQQDIEPERSGG
jgi:hypothetical protein